ncbi:MAG: ribonuclease catalytic domain-containing protein, partial [Methanoregula sp.]|nr:ribonuclease catalytic domain-containing protein [Methanoregula sp.]
MNSHRHSHRPDRRQDSAPHHPHDLDLNTIALHAMEKYGFEPRFPHSVMDDVNAMHEQIFAEIPRGVSDLRSLMWSSIDNYDSQDLDQLEYCERNPDGTIQVRIAIADVDAYVKQHASPDEYAAHNGTTIYTGVRTFPMLPERLSYGITSLLPGKDRMAVIIEYAVQLDGRFIPKDVYRALVRNKAKLVYDTVGAWLTSKGPLPKGIDDQKGLEGQIRLQNEAAQLLRKYRREQGALELDTVEPEVVMENGEIKGLVAQVQNPARELIEEFMVAANGSMVAHLSAAGVPMIQRVVKSPRNWAGIILAAATFGETLPETPDAKALSRFLMKEKAADPLHFPDLSLAVVKLLGPGEYMM